MIGKISTSLLFALTLAACGASPIGGGSSAPGNTNVGSGNNAGSNSPQPGPAPAPTLDFATVNTNVIEPKCVRCHGGSAIYGGVNLASYSGVKAHLNSIRSEVVSGGMPQGDSLTKDQYNQLISWIDAGAPQTAAAGAAEFGDTAE